MIKKDSSVYQIKKPKSNNVKKKTIPVNKPIFLGNEAKYLDKCIKTGWIGSDGEYVKKFEKNFSRYIGKRFGVAVSSGTAALDIAFTALKLQKGDEVILPTFTIISCLNPILKVGAKPVFIDADLKTWNMDVNEIEKNITKKTKIILAVHIYGLPVDMPKLMRIAKRNNIKVIEDTAEQIGQNIYNKKCGSFGDISTFSFYTNKHITTGEGGMILTNNKLLNQRSLKLRNLFFENKRRFVHREIGWNYRMSNLQAAVGLAQLENIKKLIKLKRKFGNLYFHILKKISGIDIQSYKTKYSQNIYWVIGLVIKEKNKIDKVRKYLNKKGIQTRPFFFPLHKQPLYKKTNNKKFKLPNSEYLSRNGFYLPSGLGLKISEIKYVCAKLKYILSQK